VIISHRHKFIFIKTRKTAGTSIEAALAPLCGPNDVITSDGTKKQIGFYSEYAKNFEGSFNLLREIRQQDSLLGIARSVRDYIERPRYYNHIAGLAVMSRTDRSVWENYYKFCFERNPWDKMVSFYHFYNRRKAERDQLNEYIQNKPLLKTVDQHFATDWSRYTRKNQVIVDRVYDFSDIAGGVEHALRYCGVPEVLISQIDLPRLKSDTRKDNIRLSPRSVEVIAQVFRNEIKYMNYVVPSHLIDA